MNHSKKHVSPEYSTDLNTSSLHSLTEKKKEKKKSKYYECYLVTK